jgi:hypothetical protein
MMSAGQFAGHLSYSMGAHTIGHEKQMSSFTPNPGRFLPRPRRNCPGYGCGARRRRSNRHTRRGSIPSFCSWLLPLRLSCLRVVPSIKYATRSFVCRRVPIRRKTSDQKSAQNLPQHTDKDSTAQSKMASLGWVATTVLALPADRAHHQIPEQQCADLAFCQRKFFPTLLSNA